MLACQTQGAGSDLVLIHGWGMNAAVWSELAERLAPDFRLHLIELPGHGESSLNGCGSLAAWAQACLEAAPANAAWLGWSLGAMVSLQAALLAPERINRLVLVAGTPRFVQDADWPTAMPRDVLGLFGSSLVRDPENTLDRFLSLQVRGAANSLNTLRRLRAGFRQRPTARTEALQQGLELLLHSDLREQLPQLRMPSLWLQGELDTLVPAALAGELSARLPQALVEVIPRAGHAPFLSHSEAFDGQLRAFLR